ncbi:MULTISPECIES: hypothetical protein [unclassified Fusibacter]|uniref:hypothetical protein n=1 Tax=unclassified Fusibacter TaxID=2624464 RepID=UPI0010115FF3|nr:MULTISPECIES: hypothetical protein [unclassified Fusibacter]MCK8061114.1 hypothetical protein [Fusibacter sp. A2]NPE23350.1 hypothetical protein [Fusibacter sp. A1]RXV59394.1 hypothetical protein DWB64_16145 [Fusibacter sp. A1]
MFKKKSVLIILLIILISGVAFQIWNIKTMPSFDGKLSYEYESKYCGGRMVAVHEGFVFDIDHFDNLYFVHTEFTSNDGKYIDRVLRVTDDTGILDSDGNVIQFEDIKINDSISFAATGVSRAIVGSENITVISPCRIVKLPKP